MGWWRAGALLMLLALGALPYVTPWMAKGDAAAAMPLADFPQHVGAYRLVRRWDESLVGGQVIFYWGNYTGPAGEEIALGVSPVLGAHDTLLCHVARGEDWLWHGNLPLPTANGETDFSGSFFGESGRQYMEATTLCTGDSCGQHGVGARHFGLIYSRPDARSALAGMSPQAPIPVLLRAYTSDTHLPQATARRELIGAMAEFSMHLPLVELTRPFRRRE